MAARPGDAGEGEPTSGLGFRRLVRADFSLLARWLAEPHVARWWNHEFTPEAVERDFGPAVDGDEPSEDYVVLLGGRPVGLIEYTRFDDYPEYVADLTPLLSLPGGAVSIDYLIGEKEATGRGVGRAMLAAFAERIWDTNSQAPCIVVPVSAANEASWKALIGAGFRIVAQGDLEPDNPIDDPLHQILRLDRPGGTES